MVTTKFMKPNLDKIDDAVLALLHLTSFCDRADAPPRAWKGHDWDALARLHAQGLRACLKTRPVRAPGLPAAGFAAHSCRPRALARRGSCRPRALTRRGAGVLKHALIDDPVSKAKSVVLSEAGERRARELFEQLFCN